MILELLARALNLNTREIDIEYFHDKMMHTEDFLDWGPTVQRNILNEKQKQRSEKSCLSR